MIAWLELGSHASERVSLAHAVDSRALRPAARILGELATKLGVWQRRWRERQELARLDERLLRDAGLSRYDALTEASKPFWRD